MTSFRLRWPAHLVALLLAGPALSTPAAAQLTIRLDTLPAETPDTLSIYIAGTFNAWNPRAEGFRLERQAGGGFVLTLPDSIRGPVEFKFTLGSWDGVETAPGGEDVPNRAFAIPASGAVTLTTGVARWRSGVVHRPSSASASVRILGDSVPIPQLGRARRVWIYLPPGYDSSDARYPVLYMHDGQNVFDEATSYAGEWGVDESLDSLRTAGDPGVIVVAVDHGGERRLHEYNPWVHARHGGGEGDAYVDFLVHTLKPLVDRSFRTLPDAPHTGIMGSSMGGLISLYAALKYPHVFGRAGVFSCACWIARPQLYAFARTAPMPEAPPQFYFVSGALETRDAEPARDQREMVDTLRAAGHQPGHSVLSRVADDGQHAEWFWRREFVAAYQWLFRRDDSRAP